MKIERKLAIHLLILINLVFLIFAVSLIVMGGMMLLNIFKWEGIVNSTIPTLIVFLGCLIFLFALIGFCGAILEKNSLTLLYSIFMLTLLTLEILFLFYTYYDKDKLVKMSENGLEKAWNLQQEGNADLMNVLQRGVPCCGVKGETDYEGKSIPESCYIKLRRGLITIAREGCKRAINLYINYKLNSFQYILMAIMALQGLIFALGCFVSGYSAPENVEFLRRSSYFR